jgi:hypothetical protein
MPIYILAAPTFPVPDTMAVVLPHSRMGNSPKHFQFPNACTGYLTHPLDFFGFLAEISSDDSFLPPSWSRSFCINTHLDRLDNRF